MTRCSFHHHKETQRQRRALMDDTVCNCRVGRRDVDGLGGQRRLPQRRQDAGDHRRHRRRRKRSGHAAQESPRRRCRRRGRGGRRGRGVGGRRRARQAVPVAAAPDAARLARLQQFEPRPGGHVVPVAHRREAPLRLDALPKGTVESGYIIHPRTGPKWLI